MAEIQVIYKKGKSNIEAIVNDGVTQYGKKPIAEAIEETGGELMDFEEALNLIADVLEERYNKPFKEIDEFRYQEMLEVLPPEVWMTGQNFKHNGKTYNAEGFRLCEYMEAQYTQHFYCINLVPESGEAVTEEHTRMRYFEAIRAADPAAPINDGVSFIMNAQANVAMGVYVPEILELL